MDRRRSEGGWSGKLLILPYLFDRYWEELEADFLAQYQTDLCDVWRGRLSLRKVGVLIRQLLPGSRLHRARGGVGAWPEEVAAIHDRANQIVDVICAVNDVKESKRPKPVEPPEEGWQDKAREREAKASRKMRNWLARHPEVMV